MKIAIIQFPGTNRDSDLADALQLSGHKVVFVWHLETILPSGLDMVCLPGGFAYGDYLRTGAMAAHAPIMRAVKQAAANGMYILGICNGFQILCESGILDGILTKNTGLQFICDWQECIIKDNDSVYFKHYNANQAVYFPIAHGEGNYQCDDETLEKLVGDGRIALEYAGNPNGSRRNIAGIYSANKRVLGMMPHPENASMEWHKYTDGKLCFTLSQ